MAQSCIPFFTKEMQRKNKFNVQSKDTRIIDGIQFDSTMEMNYYKDIILPGVKSGEITSFELQPKFILQPKFDNNGKHYREISYVADFKVCYANGDELVVDVKGFADSVAKLKQKIFIYHYPTVNYKWLIYSKIDGGWCEYDYVKKQRAIRKREKKEKLK